MESNNREAHSLAERNAENPSKCMISFHSHTATVPTFKNEHSWIDFKVQILCVIVIGVSMIHAGLTIAFTNLLNNHFSEQVVSTFAGLSALATPIGSCIVSVSVDKCGRKYNLMIIQVFCIITWISASLIDGTNLLYLCAILAGLSRGALTASCPAYISEITHSRYRQLFLSLTSAFFTLGIFIISVLHVLMTYKQSGIFLTVCFTVLIISTAFIVPESPHWLAVIKLDFDSAKSNLKRLNPNDEFFHQEWRSIEEKIQQKSSRILSTKEKFLLMGKPSAYKPCLILLGLIFFQQFCGIYPFTSYTLWSLPKLGKLGEIHQSKIFLASGIIRLIVSFATSIALLIFNQKQVLLVSSLGMMLSGIVLVINREIIANVTADAESCIEWVSVISFLFYLLSGFIGLLGIPWTIIFELLPTEIKGILGPFLVAIGYATMSLVLKLFPYVYDIAGTTNAFIYVIVISACATIYVHYFVMETKGKSLYEIENFYSKKQVENTNDDESDVS